MRYIIDKIQQAYLKWKYDNAEHIYVIFKANGYGFYREAFYKFKKYKDEEIPYIIYYSDGNGTCERYSIVPYFRCSTFATNIYLFDVEEARSYCKTLNDMEA